MGGSETHSHGVRGKGFADLEAKFGTALVESFELHKTLYPRECKNSLQAQMDELMGLLRERISVMDRLMEDCGESGIKAPEVVGGNMPERLFSVDGRQYLEKRWRKIPYRSVYPSESRWYGGEIHKSIRRGLQI